MTSDRSRGQLLLVGGIAIALLILGLVVALNAVVFTETSGDQGTTQALNEGSAVDQEVQAGIDAVGHEANFDRKYNRSRADRAVLLAEVNESVTNVSVPIQTVQADNAGAFVGVANVTAATAGTRVVQDNTSNFTADGSDYPFDRTDWYPVGNSTEFGPTPTDNAAAIGRVEVVVDPDNSSDGTLNLSAEYADQYRGDSERFVEIEVIGDDVEISGTGVTEPCSIDSGGDEVTVLVSEGWATSNETCRIDLIDPVDRQELRFHGDTGDVEGRYNITTETFISPTPASPPVDNRWAGYDSGTTPRDEPHLSMIVWDVEVELEYDIDEVTAARDGPEATDVTPSGGGVGCPWLDSNYSPTSQLNVDVTLRCNIDIPDPVQTELDGVVYGYVDTGDNLDMIDESVIYGNVSAINKVDIDGGSQVYGPVETDSGEVVLDNNALVTGSVDAGNKVTVDTNSVIKGKVNSDDEIVANAGGRIEADAVAQSNVDIDDGTVEGNLVSRSGNVNLDNGATIEGDVYVDSGDDSLLNCGTGVTINGQSCSNYKSGSGPKDEATY